MLFPQQPCRPKGMPQLPGRGAFFQHWAPGGCNEELSKRGTCCVLGERLQWKQGSFRWQLGRYLEELQEKGGTCSQRPRPGRVWGRAWKSEGATGRGRKQRAWGARGTLSGASVTWGFLAGSCHGMGHSSLIMITSPQAPSTAPAPLGTSNNNGHLASCL